MFCVIHLDTFHDNWPHGASHSPHTPITQNIAWVAYQALKTSWGWQPYAETCRGRKIWNVLIKHPLLPWVFVGFYAIDTKRCSVQPSRSRLKKIIYATLDSLLSPTPSTPPTPCSFTSVAAHELHTRQHQQPHKIILWYRYESTNQYRSQGN
jgi:hypothetical protein